MAGRSRAEAQRGNAASAADDCLARIPPIVVAGLCTLGKERGIATDEWWHGTGLSPSIIDQPDALLSYRQTTAILRSALADLPAGPIGLALGSRDVLLSWGLLGVALRSCRTGGELLATGLEHHQSAGSLMDFDAVLDDGRVDVILTSRGRDDDLLRFCCEEAFAGMAGLLRATFGPDAHPLCCQFPYSSPPWADVYERHFGCAIQFDADRACMSVPADFLDRPIPTASAAQFAAALGAVRQTLELDEWQPDIVTTVESVLREDLRHLKSMAQVAARLGVSERTVRRRLADVGERFGDLRDRLRLSHAQQLLRGSTLPVSVVAADVGYSDVREFRRAYQRWTGRTPSEERARNVEDAGRDGVRP